MKIALFLIAFSICLAGSVAIKIESFKIKWYWADNKLIGLFYITAAIMLLIILVKEIKTVRKKRNKKTETANDIIIKTKKK